MRQRKGGELGLSEGWGPGAWPLPARPRLGSPIPTWRQPLGPGSLPCELLCQPHRPSAQAPLERGPGPSRCQLPDRFVRPVPAPSPGVPALPTCSRLSLEDWGLPPGVVPQLREGGGLGLHLRGGSSDSARGSTGPGGGVKLAQGFRVQSWSGFRC